jgi:two-component system NarL family response regulator
MHSDPLLCAGLVAALRAQTDFEVLVDRVDAGNSRIDVVIADYLSAMLLAHSDERDAGAMPGSRILAVTGRDRETDIRRAIEAGVHGYLLLGGPLSELVEAATAVAAGSRYLSRSVAQRMADSLSRAALTAREVDVLQLVVAGESNKAIARHLCIEIGTVKSHLSAIMAKLGASSRTQAAGIASTRGLVEEPVATTPIPLGVRRSVAEPATYPWARSVGGPELRAS